MGDGADGGGDEPRQPDEGAEADLDRDDREIEVHAVPLAQAVLGRGHDLVIIGVNMDAAAATRVLDACLV